MYTHNINSNWAVQCTAITLLMLSLSSPSAYAVPSGTSVSNSATVSFEVNTVPQADVTSSAATFLVDKKVDLTVATINTAPTTVTPGDTDVNNNVLTFTVTNTGNDAQDFFLSPSAVTTGNATRFNGAVDAFDIANANIAVFVEDGANTNYQALEDTATHIDALAAGDTQTVYIVSTLIPTDANNNEYASYHLIAEARADDSAPSLGGALTNTSGADTAGVDTVFADGAGSDDVANDARHSSQNDYNVASAAISILKTSSAFWDPVNINTNPKRIPGGRVEYTITVSNAAGASPANNITILDDLTAENANIVYYPDGYAAGQGISLSINGAAETLLTGAADADAGSYDEASHDLSVSGITLNAGDTATIKFQVTIQ